MTSFHQNQTPSENRMGGKESPALPVVAILLSRQMRDQILSPEAQRQLAKVSKVRTTDADTLTREDLPALLHSAVVAVTGWGTPPLDQNLLGEHPELRLIAHTAGSVRKLVPGEAIGGTVQVSHAASVLADAVAEFVIGSALRALWHFDQLDDAMRHGGEWFDLRARYLGRTLGARTVGIIGAGYVGQRVIRLLTAFGSRVLVCDPVMTSEQAMALGVELTGLDDLLASSDIVSLHAPVLPETRGMIGASQLARLSDGALFINSARSALIDEAALLAELERGRIHAVLDVYDTEPMPHDSEFRSASNVQITPHVAGHTFDTHRQQGQAMVDEVKRFLNGESLEHEVTAAMIATMA